MELPPRVKTQYPNKENIANDKITSLPLEYAFFREDGEPDPSKINRYYFNFPGNWVTSNNGEIIVGVRDIWLVHKRRKLELTLLIYKALKSDYNKYGNAENDQYLTKDIQDKLGKYLKVLAVPIIDWISVDGDLRGFFDATNLATQKVIELTSDTIWCQNDKVPFDRDVQTDGYYDDNGFHEIIYSPRNSKGPLVNDKHVIFFKIINTNKDFDEIFNIGTEPFQNRYEKYNNLPCKELIFDNVWDRHSCKVFSSIGEQCNHQYIGNSNVYFDPIKYFKLQSNDQRFWVEFYSARNYKIPVKLPKGETFCIEMQFLPFEKKLSV